MIEAFKDWLGRKRFRRAIRRWFSLKGDETLRLDYPLDTSSVVFDVGGYEGDFAAAIHERYGCTVHVFEPVETFFEILRKRFVGNDRVIIHPFGLGGRTETVTMNLEANSSSHVKDGDTSDGTIKAEIVSFSDFIQREGIQKVDLMKVNIEGAEFDLLDHMIVKGNMPMIGNLQVQFHRFVPNAPSRRHALRSSLRLTHELTYEFYFVWENWRLIKA